MNLLFLETVKFSDNFKDIFFKSYHDKMHTFLLFCIAFFNFWNFTTYCHKVNFIAYITWISFVFKWMIQSFKRRMRIFAFETQWTPIFLILQKTFAIIWKVCILIRRSPEILRFMRINTLRPIMFYVFLRTIGCFIPVDVKHIWI